MKDWTAEGFQDAFTLWLESEKPSDESQRRFLLWARRVALDPFDASHAVPYPDVGPGWWFAAIPDVGERLIIVVYRVDDFYRVVTCSMVVFLDEPDDDD
jgi:hypothetical protein